MTPRRRIFQKLEHFQYTGGLEVDNGEKFVTACGLFKALERGEGLRRFFSKDF